MRRLNFQQLVIGIIVLIIFVYFGYLKTGNTADTNLLSLKGWGWIGADCTDPNETSCGTMTLPIGWISFSSDNPEITCKNISYGVRINTSTGEISGAAWIGVGENNNCNTNENTVGWLYFDSNQTPPCGQNGYPSDSDYCFPAELVGNEIQGWAPIISKDYLGNATTVTWVRFKGSNHGVNYGVKINTDDNTVTGYAWSGVGKEEGLGWIWFKNVKVSTASLPPSPPSPAVLNVQSSPITGVSIIANPSQFGGTTNYSTSSTSTISASLTAPTTSNSYTFDRWEGCGLSSNNSCNVSVNPGQTKTVIAVYTTTSAITTFDLAVTSLDIRTFICKNKNFDTTFVDDYRSQNPNYQFFPSSTYATAFYNKVASSTCPESQRNRPVEFFAQGTCLKSPCPASKLKIDIISNSPLIDQETTSSVTVVNTYPKSITFLYTFNKPYDYKVKACFFDQNGNPIDDENNDNNCKEQTIRIFDYLCLYGFCHQAKRDINNPDPIFGDLKYRIIQTFTDHDYPCRYYRNEICQAIIR
jgi:hypothetical protein